MMMMKMMMMMMMLLTMVMMMMMQEMSAHGPVRALQQQLPLSSGGDEKST